MSIRSLFGMKDKNLSSEGCAQIPKLPSQREILEDIDNIAKNDPLLSLAAILEKKGRHSVVDTDIKELVEALQKRKRRESTSSNSSGTTLVSMPFNLPLLNLTGPSKGILKSTITTDSKKKEIMDMDPNNRTTEDLNQLDYDKLKHFLTTCEHSQELILTMEAEFKKFQSEITEYTKSLDDELNHSVEEPNNLL